MFHVNQFLNKAQQKMVLGRRMSKYSGNVCRNCISSLKTIVQSIPLPTGKVDGKKAYLRYVARNDDGSKSKYFITAFDKSTRSIEGIVENGKSYPFSFNMNLDDLLSSDSFELDLEFKPSVPEIGLR
jgi:hypothetical protein